MDATHKAKLADARRDAAIKRQEIDDQNARDFCEWIVMDAQAHAAYIDAVGPVSTANAYREWREVVELMPPVPTNAAMRRVRGLDQED